MNVSEGEGMKRLKPIHQKWWVLFLLMLIAVGVLAMQVDVKEIMNGLDQLPYGMKECGMVLLVAVQVVLAFLPGEPLELASGYLFGTVTGTILCLIGSLLGTFIVFLIAKRFGRMVLKRMFSAKEIEQAERFMNRKSSILGIFFLFLVPGTPKDIMTYLICLSDARIVKWLCLTTVGRIPSIMTSTMITGSLKVSQCSIAIVMMVITVVLSCGGVYLYRRCTDCQR